jgi:hypothetical protein
LCLTSVRVFLSRFVHFCPCPLLSLFVSVPFCLFLSLSRFVPFCPCPVLSFCCPFLSLFVPRLAVRSPYVVDPGDKFSHQQCHCCGYHFETSGRLPSEWCYVCWCPVRFCRYTRICPFLIHYTRILPAIVQSCSCSGVHIMACRIRV